MDGMLILVEQTGEKDKAARESRLGLRDTFLSRKTENDLTIPLKRGYYIQKRNGAHAKGTS